MTPSLALALRSSSAWSAFLPRAASCAAAERARRSSGVVLAIRINIASLRPRTVTPFSLRARMTGLHETPIIFPISTGPMPSV
ncbi:hypothetical protein [Salmonella phage vB_StyS-sam]|uniref:Uncharacterized protein n=1 Tax=Salmonella phage vB_StyS-sam TaxID=2664131 RepID=A0A5K7YAZ0_9CAUD|nr:hypothetical protein QA026_gp42 [Salmonella phage vB_StyS-sam]BBO65995.1 hypothetical protein [Salmonella phage vB_StyS-sam]